MDIEVFPAEKSCEQGCVTCPLARKDNIVTAKVIDPQVQTTFSLLEEVLANHDVQYNLHTTSSLDLLPALNHPSLIRMARFETDKKNIGLDTNPSIFSERVKTLCETHGIKPKSIGFSFVPQSPILSEEDLWIIKNVFDAISDWHFHSQHKEIEITIRSNLIALLLFKEVQPHLYARDTALLKPFAQEQGTLYKARKKPKLFSFTGSSIYYNRYVASAHRKKVTIINRVIGATQKTHTHELHMRQVKALYPRKLRSVDFAIAPKGVMFMHTSLAINNPILWMSHAEFQARLITESHKSGFSILKFAQDNICRNAVLYKMEHMDCK